MRISIKPGTMNEQPALFVYRPRQRKPFNSTHAYQTKSGRWIVSFGAGYNMMCDVAEDRKAAEAMLYKFFEDKGNH